MSIKWHYIAETEAGSRTEIQVDETHEMAANVQAKIEVERWLKDEGETPDRLIRFDLVFREPAA